MPIQQILTQPNANSLNAAYAPIVLRVQATSSTNYPEPPAVYCDIYVNGTFYRTLSRSQADQVNDTNSEWQFDIQDVQEVFTRYIGPNGGMAILKPDGLHAIVFCRFRSSYADDDNIIQPDPDVPVQSTGSTPAVAGSGLESNAFIVVNATLKHEDNPNLNLHLAAYRKGQWDAQAFPLSHRPDNYIVTRNDSDFFPFIYAGNKSVRCLLVRLYKKDGTQQLLSYCTDPEPCTIVVSGIRIIKAPDRGDGRTYYYAIFAVSNTADHYKIELSTNAGSSWLDITGLPDYNAQVNFSTLSYNASADGSPTSHMVRITPYCDPTVGSVGTAGTGTYVLLGCPTVTDITVTYNAQSQQFNYIFHDDSNLDQTVQLFKDGAPIFDARTGASNSGSWTLTQSGNYYITVQTPCAIGTPITETSNSIDVVVSNPICNAPSSVVASFTSDGHVLHAVWSVGDQTYPDLAKLYRADNNSLLQQQVTMPGAFIANFNVDSYTDVQQFYVTVQHQCPSPSVLGKSNTIQRTNNWTLALSVSSDQHSVSVTCHRYGVLAPAPFTAAVKISLSYNAGPAGLVNTTASGYIIQGDSSDYIYGSPDVQIIFVNITEVTPSVSGTSGYVF